LSPYDTITEDQQDFRAPFGMQPHKTKTGRQLMFEAHRPKTRTRSAFSMLVLIYHSIVREIRKDHRNAVVGLIMNMMQTVVFVIAFYFMFSVLGLKGSAIRGDFLLYIMSGIFLFLTHTKAMGAVLKADGPASAMMKHAPMNTIVAITSAAIASLYIQVLSMSVVLFIYHVIFGPITIIDPISALGAILLGWFSGVAVGIIFLAIKPWFPGFVAIASSIYARANMIASGKMFVANSLPGFMLPVFDWNPLFHCIDQARGFIFINYNPHYTTISYPIKVSIILIMIGLMLEFYTRKNASVSWDAAR
jgi:ABC-type polysaccharide/polyol phosphate export permease